MSGLPARARAPARLGRALPLLAALALWGCAHAPQGPRAGRVPAPPVGPGGCLAPFDEGLASFYGPGLYGRRTASGERLGRGELTAAHRSLRFGTCVRVVNVRNGRSVRVRVNDRGPFIPTRIMDVSEEAARQLGMDGRGVVRVRLYLCAAGEPPCP